MNFCKDRQVSWKLYSGFLFLVIFLAYWLFSIQYYGPAYLSDEIGYLSKAAAFAGYPVDMASSWHGGYSMILSPLFMFFSDPYVIWQAILVLNAVIFTISFMLLFYFLKLVFPEKTSGEVLLAVGLCSIYPAWITMSGYAFSTPAFVLIFMLAIISLHKVKAGNILFVIPHSLLAGFLYWIHPTGLAVVVASAVVVSVLAFYRRKASFLIFHLVILTVMVLAYRLFVHEWFNWIMTPEGYSARSHYQTLSMVFERIRSINFWKIWLFLTLGHFSYVLIASFGVILFAFGEIARRIRYLHTEISHKTTFSANFSLLFVALSFAGVLLLSSLSFATIPVANISDLTVDTWIYGRYIEGILLPLLGVGLMAFGKSKKVLYGALFVVFSGLLISTVKLNMSNNLVNIPAFWPQAFFSEGPFLGWILLGASGIIFANVFKKKFFVIVAVPLFIICIFNQRTWHEGILSYYSKPSGMVELVRSNFDRGVPVGFESFMPEGTDGFQQERFNLYSYYFFNYDYRRMSSDEWFAEGRGAYLTYHPEVFADFQDIWILAREVRSGLFLVTRDSELNNPDFSFISRENLYINSSEDNASIISGCYSIEASFLKRFSNVGFYDEGKLLTNGRKGHLFFGPYVALKKGNYCISIEGKFINLEGAVLDITSNVGGVKHFEAVLADYFESGLKTLEIPFELQSDVKDLEVRLFVSEDSEMEIAGYEVRLRSEAGTKAVYHGDSL